VLRAVAAISLVYDLSAGVVLLLFRGPAISLVPSLNALLSPSPLLADLLGLFLVCVGFGYVLPYRDPRSYRAYLWIFGGLLKTAGAAAFAAHYAWRESSGLILLFALSDGAMAALTLAALLSVRGDTRDKSGSPGR
jgi:hypothetical protein